MSKFWLFMVVVLIGCASLFLKFQLAYIYGVYSVAEQVENKPSQPTPSPVNEAVTNEVVTSYVQHFPAAGIKTCNSQQAQFQASRFAIAKVRGCPPSDDIWMRLVHLVMPRASVFVDIGSNKGYTAARFYSLWNPELGLTAPKWYKTMQQVSRDPEISSCGQCNDCREDTEAFASVGARMCGPESAHTTNPNAKRTLQQAGQVSCNHRQDKYTPIRVYSFDGNNVLVNAVKNGIKTLAGNDAKLKEGTSNNFLPEYLPGNPGYLLEKYWSVEQQAFSDVYEPGKTLTFIESAEVGHIADDRNDKTKGRRVTVPVLTVDQLMIREGLDYIDFLKIDTEGFDLMVIEGAQKSLSQHKVGILLFELNTVWPKMFKGSSTPLKQVITELGGKGYVCYLEGKNLMLRFTFCWDDLLEKNKAWSNIWCASSHSSSGHAVISVFDSYSLAFN